ncbi:MAG: exonuclease SbcD [Planctomycetota bacterium]
MTFRFLHIADLHLDSAYGGSPPTVERLRSATKEALSRAVAFAIDETLDAVLIAGDAFDEERLGFEARAAFRRELERLSEHGITVVYITGNHDPGAAAGRAAGLRLARSIGSPGRAPIHVVLDGTPRLLHLRSRGGDEAAEVIAVGHATSRVTDNLARAMRETLDADAGARRLPRIGLLHTQVGSAAGAEGHEPYAPCTASDLMACDLDYWALGHVHIRGQVDPAVPAYYAGNLQGRNARESGPKGGWLVELDTDGLTHEPEFIPFAPVEFFRCEGEPSKDDEPEDLAGVIAAALDEAASLGHAPAARELIVRLDVTGHGGRWPDGFAEAVRDELQRLSGPVFGDFLEVQLRAARGGKPSTLEALKTLEELRAMIEGTPSALREALAVCRALDAKSAESREPAELEDALLQRLAARTRS